MEVEHARQLGEELEENILALIHEFESYTGFFVEGMEHTRLCMTLGKPYTTAVDLDVRLYIRPRWLDDE